MNVILQPIHLLLYMSLIGAAGDLAARNPIYALVAMFFLIPAEKFVKNMFGLNKASSTSDFGSFTKNALAYEGLKRMGSAVTGGAKALKTAKGASSEDAQDSEGIEFNKIKRAELGSYAQNTGDVNNNSENLDKSDNPRLADSKELSEEQKKQMELENIRQEKDRLGQELEDYENNGGDVYSSTDPEIQAKQLRYAELAEQESGFNARPSDLEESQDQLNNRTNINMNVGKQPAGYKRRIAGRVGKAVLKGGLKGAVGATKLATKAGLAGVGATIGLASAISTGDLSNVAQYTIGGAVAGKQIGKGMINLAGNTTKTGVQAVQAGKNAINNMKDVINEEKYGVEAAKQMRDERVNAAARDKFLKNKKEIKKYTDMKMDIGYNGSVESLMNAAADYKELGVGDDMIKNALKVENKNDGTVGGINHEKMLDVASFATSNGYKKSDILSNKQRSDMEDAVQSTVAEKDRYQVMKNIADLYGAGEFYSKNSRFKPVSSNKQTVSNTKAPSNIKKPANNTQGDNGKIRKATNNE